MKPYTVLGLLLLATCHSTFAKKDSSSSIILGPSSDNNCQTVGLQCKDCETIQYCSEDKTPVFQTRCADQSKSHKYCDVDTNSCVKETPIVCDVEEQTFICPGVGTYPDLENCYNYYICDENKEATKFGCSIGFMYSQEIQACIPGYKCKSFSGSKGHCKDKTNKLIEYASGSDLYVLCLADHPRLFQCQVEGDTFIEEEVTCRFECTESGFFPYRPDASKFYSCLSDGKKLVTTLLDCPEGTEFVELGEGQGICTIKTTTTTTTEAAGTTAAEQPTTEGDVEGSGEAPEGSENEEVPQGDAQQENVFEAVNESQDEVHHVETIENEK